MNPQREERNLLPSDPRRRPGDLHFALWPGSTGVAIDFAVTSPYGGGRPGRNKRKSIASKGGGGGGGDDEEME